MNKKSGFYTGIGRRKVLRTDKLHNNKKEYVTCTLTHNGEEQNDKRTRQNEMCLQ